MTNLQSRIARLELRTHKGGGRRPVDWIIVCEDDTPFEVHSVCGLRTADGASWVTLGEGETVEDAKAKFIPIEERETCQDSH